MKDQAYSEIFRNQINNGPVNSEQLMKNLKDLAQSEMEMEVPNKANLEQAFLRILYDSFQGN
jgi:hypothetical protein